MILPFLGTGYLNAQKLSKNDAFDILTKWEGKWKNSAVFEKSIWTKERTETRGITETNLILSNNYLEIMVYNDDNISKHIICYDQTTSQFNRQYQQIRKCHPWNRPQQKEVQKPHDARHRFQWGGCQGVETVQGQIPHARC